MPTCPKCNENVNVLIYVQLAERRYEVSLDEASVLDYNILDNYTDIKEEEYRCSECGATLFKDEGEAIKFLKSPP